MRSSTSTTAAPRRDPTNLPGELTVDLLRELIPTYQNGIHAREQLPHTPAHDHPQLRTVIAAGEAAADTLYRAALPFIKMLAYREYNRRCQNTTVLTLLDVEQEAAAGFLRGIAAIDITKIGRSATNYLGQWISVELDRSLASLEHDMSVSTNASNRMRRINAIRNKLLEELNREPTVEEIVAASRQPASSTVKWATTRDQNGKQVIGVTEAQVREAHQHRNRTGQQNRFTATPTDGETHELDVPDTGTELRDGTATPEEEAMREAHQNGLRELLTQVITVAGLTGIDTEIISRRHGLDPFPEEETISHIAAAMQVSKTRVTNTLKAFEAALLSPNGPLSVVIQGKNFDELDALGLTWLAQRFDT
jgi:DNA-directed RNA polymerase sigma subunit (sigma70/sigma32)